MTSAADLASLQEIDLRRDARRALIAEIESRLVETEELIAAREEVTTCEAALDQLRRDQRDLEAQLADLDAKIEPLERKLYDGSVRNPKELTDMQHEVNSWKARRGVLDDKGLALLESLEAAAAALRGAQEQLRQAQADWETSQADLRQDKERAQADEARLESERDRWAQNIDQSTLGLYENLRRSKQGRAVARLERGACQGCRLSLPTHVAQRVRTGGSLVQCPSCERILVGA
jgi:predicted  nucleic acid-binding Zn-ribbon protein